MLGVTIVSSGKVKFDGRDHAEGDALEFILRAVDFSERRRGLEAFDGELPIFFRDLEAAVGEFGIGVL